ncbi:MAG: hypothetical protein HQ567_00465 [Candidatus Nealsonbacteria bacterium]|nr:hypothetical protein [Candidatus Nealsonbacteria bacterium]
MFRTLTHSRLLWLGVGVLGALILTGGWPDAPLHAVATDRCQTYAMATGPVDEEVEAVYFLDFLTGNLNALVMGKQNSGFTGFFQRDVRTDLGIDPSKNPRFMMVTGMVAQQRGGTRARPSLAAVYVAEITTGKVAAYAIPWSKSMHAAGQPQKAQLLPLGWSPFRAVGAGAGAGGTAVPPPRPGT